MRRRRVLAQLALAFSACGSEPVFVQWPSESPFLAFLVVHDPSTQNSRVIYQVDLGRGQALEFPFEEGSDILLVTLDRESISLISPEADFSQPGGFSARFENETCTAGRLLAGDRLQFPLPMRARVRQLSEKTLVDLSFDQAPVLNHVALAVPQRTTADAELEPFGPTSDVLDDEVLILGTSHTRMERRFFELRQILRLDQDHLLAAAPGVIYFFERGRRFTDSPTERLAVEQLPPCDRFRCVINSLVRIPGAGPTEPTRVWALAEPQVAPFPASLIFELAFDEKGILEVRTATVVPGRLRKMVIDHRNRLIAVGAAGSLLFADPVGSPFARRTLGDRDLVGILATEDPSRPHLILDASAGVTVGDVLASDGLLGLKMHPGPTDIAPSSFFIHGFSARLGPAGLEVYFGDSDRHLFRLDLETGWAPGAQVAIPASARSCASASAADNCGHSVLGPEVVPALAKNADSESTLIYLPYEGCLALLSYRPEVGRAFSLAPRDKPLGSSREEFSILDLTAEVLTAAGAGRIYEARVDGASGEPTDH